jgi:hypothetical protein
MTLSTPYSTPAYMKLKRQSPAYQPHARDSLGNAHHGTFCSTATPSTRLGNNDSVQPGRADGMVCFRKYSRWVCAIRQHGGYGKATGAETRLVRFGDAEGSIDECSDCFILVRTVELAYKMEEC